jgi:hypothetical protein
LLVLPRDLQQEILAQTDDENFEFPVGIIFSAQTSLRVVSELVRDVTKEDKKAPKKAKKAKKAEKAGKGAKAGKKR